MYSVVKATITSVVIIIVACDKGERWVCSGTYLVDEIDRELQLGHAIYIAAVSPQHQLYPPCCYVPLCKPSMIVL